MTADLASNFGSATQRAGLELRIDCPPLPSEVFVDRDMWEKIVLNLVSDAFKFTFAGAIAVEMRQSADRAAAELAVRDTGTGIPRMPSCRACSNASIVSRARRAGPSKAAASGSRW